MTDITKWMNIPIADIEKIMGIEKANLSKFMELDIAAAGPSWWSRYDWGTNDCFYGTGEGIAGEWKFSTGNGYVVTEVGTWSDGYRPTKVRITHNGTGTGLRVYVKDKNGATIGDSGADYVSGAEISLTWGSYDLSGFVINNSDFWGLTFSNVEWQSAIEPGSCGGGGGE